MSTVEGGGKIVTNGLILHLDAANQNSYSGSGVNWVDLTVNRNIGTLTNGASFSTSNLGTITFDGTNDWVNLGEASSIRWSQVRTISFWYRWDTFVNGEHVLTMWDLVNGVNQRTIIHSIGASNQIQQFWSPNGIADGSVISGSTSLSLNIWYNFTSVFRSGVRELWQNGILIGTLSQATIYTGATTNRLGISCVPARSIDNPQEFTNGSMSSLFLYNRALSSEEIIQNYNTHKGRFGL